MTKRELSRAEVFLRVQEKKISQIQAAEELCLSLRQVQRQWKDFRERGIAGLTSKKRGKASNHQLPPFLKKRVLELVTCDAYAGFGPTFMCEKLEQIHQIKISVETTRQLMIQSEMWQGHRKKRPVIHQQRKRRARFGELVQIDGSPHAWFEDRGAPCDLIVFIDDATGHTFGKFVESETTVAYMTTMREYIMKYGRPLALYSDKDSIFRVNRPSYSKEESITQFGRAMKELDIKLFWANSPQAKGRVERANQTHQDRLIKELRLAGISTIEAANRFLEGYWKTHNKKFGVPPSLKDDAHRVLLPEHDLDRILCYKEHRILSKNLELQYKSVIYQVTCDAPSWSLRGAKVVVLEKLDGTVSVEYNGRCIPVKEYRAQVHYGVEATSKEIERFLKGPRVRHVPCDHPWKRSPAMRRTRTRDP